ncbi:MAG: tetratricopeptide repeat protein [Ignavibacteria bacterium]|nr:tetratricopeptide repeat protein [Ignavibacteria bacterium]
MLYEEALTLFRNKGHKTGIANSLHGLGNAAFLQSEFTDAKKYFEECLELRRETGNNKALLKPEKYCNVLSEIEIMNWRRVL